MELHQFEIVVRVSWHQWRIEYFRLDGNPVGQWCETHVIEARNEDAAREIFFDDYAETDVKHYEIEKITEI
jgi:hypothetical protein